MNHFLTSTQPFLTVAWSAAAGILAAVAGVYVANKRLKLLGHAERGKLEAERENILAQAEERSTARALEALKLALSQAQQERLYYETQLNVTRERLAVAESEARDLKLRVASLEARIGGRRSDEPV